MLITYQITELSSDANWFTVLFKIVYVTLTDKERTIVRKSNMYTF